VGSIEAEQSNVIVPIMSAVLNSLIGCEELIIGDSRNTFDELSINDSSILSLPVNFCEFAYINEIERTFETIKSDDFTKEMLSLNLCDSIYSEEAVIIMEQSNCDDF
jgi:hypothetical protein